MSSYTLRIQQYSPLITYSIGWAVGEGAGDYNEGFMVTNTPSATARVTFEGTGLRWYGAKRPNHGKYEVFFDQTSQVGAGYEGTESFRVILFETHDQPVGLHTFQVVNRPEADKEEWLDIDWIELDYQLESTDTEAEMATFLPSGVGLLPTDWEWKWDEKWSANGPLESEELGASSEFTFIGESATLYGSIGEGFGQLEVTLDDLTTTIVNLTSSVSVESEILYHTHVKYGKHTLKFRNAPPTEDNKKVSIANVAVRGIKNSITSSSGSSTPSTPAPTRFDQGNGGAPRRNIAGALLGGLLGLMAISTLL